MSLALFGTSFGGGSATAAPAAVEPTIEEVRSGQADQTSALLEAEINPRGFATTYRFEWGVTNSYGHRVPADFDLYAGTEEGPVRVTAKLSGLTTGTRYHYRVVATSTGGTTASPDQVVETLNQCGMPEGRCVELVSPPDVGPVDLPGERSGANEFRSQIPNRSGVLAYISEGGPPEVTNGAEVSFEAMRGPETWSSRQLSPAINGINESADGASASSKILAYNQELTCGLVESNTPLTDNPAMRQIVEDGGSNLYRRNADLSYTGITTLVPTNPEVSEGIANFEVFATSEDCSKVVFQTQYSYPGVQRFEGPGAPGSERYEWNQGQLRSLSYVPKQDGTEEISHPYPLRDREIESYNSNAVSQNGSRVFFRAQRLASPNPAEVTVTIQIPRGIFVREDDITKDISLSETETPDNNPNFEFASPDGQHVFFTAAAGLTEESSTEGIDLYEYNFELERLVDLSPASESSAAEVLGFIGASTDGSHIYFGARGQLVPGSGPTLSENTSEETMSIYSERDGVISYVGTSSEPQQGGYLLTGIFQTARVSPNGRYLLFESGNQVTGYQNSGGASQAYLYDSLDLDEPVVCISCRQDGKASASPIANRRMIDTTAIRNVSLYSSSALAERGGEPIVFFCSFDVLAPGAVGRVNNVYEWAHGQIFLITSEPPGLSPPENVNRKLVEQTRLFGADPTGTDVYLVTPGTLTWEDGDARSSIYDARVGGGHPQPSVAAPCNPSSEGSCQSASSDVPSSAPPASEGVQAPAARPVKPVHHRHKKHKHRRKRRHRGKNHQRAHSGHRDADRHASHDRGDTK